MFQLRGSRRSGRDRGPDRKGSRGKHDKQLRANPEPTVERTAPAKVADGQGVGKNDQVRSQETGSHDDVVGAVHVLCRSNIFLTRIQW